MYIKLKIIYSKYSYLAFPINFIILSNPKPLKAEIYAIFFFIYYKFMNIFYQS